MFNLELVKELSDKEKKVIMIMEKDFIRVMKMSITAFSVKVGCSPSFLTKLLKKVGYYGWKDWVGFTAKYITTPQATDDYGKYIKSTLIDSIYATLSSLDEFDVNEIVNLMDKKKHLAFVGTQFGKDICRDQKRRYNKSGKSSQIYDSHNGEMAAIPNNSLVFILSISGKGSNQRKIVNYLKTNKKDCILIFLSSFSKIKNVDHYDYTLTGVVHENLDINEKELPRHSRIIMYTLLDLVYLRWFNKHKKIINKNIRKVISNDPKIR